MTVETKMSVTHNFEGAAHPELNPVDTRGSCREEKNILMPMPKMAMCISLKKKSKHKIENISML